MVMVLAVLVAVIVVVMQVIGALNIAATRHHENMAVGTHDVDLGTV